MAADMFFNICMNLGESLPFLNRASKRRKIDADSQIAEYGRWHELPVELMEMILQHLDLADRVCMSVVCKSWGSMVMEKDIRVPPEFPWLLLPHIRNRKNLSFYNMSRGKIHNVKLPYNLAHGGWQCCGSSKGWLVMANKTQVFLLNPLSGIQHQLPSLTTIPYFNDANYYDDPYQKVLTFIVKIELSSNDPSKCTVAAIFGNYQVLACCRTKDKSWTIFQGTEIGDEDRLCDILFCNERLYAMTTKTPQHMMVKFTAATSTMKLADDDHQVVTLKLLPHIRSFIEEKPTPAVNYFENFAIHEEGKADCYLIESNDSTSELLILRQYIDELFPSRHEDDDEDDDSFPSCNYNRTSRFEVYKCSPADEDDGSGTSFCISRLESLGDKVLFLTQGGSSFISTATSQATGNCIYFSDDLSHYQDECELCISRDAGVFYLDDERIQRPFPSVQLPRQSRMCWLSPNLSS